MTLFRSTRLRPALFLCVLALLSACGSGSGAAPTRTLRPRTATPTPEATFTPRPPVTRSAAGSTTATRPATAAPTAPPTVAANIWPLTGLPADNPEQLKRVPLAVKVSNIPEARPQSGLQAADIVFEHLAEGGITRFTAIFQSHDASDIGPLRSARLIDLEIPAMYQCPFFYSGASGPVLELIRNSDLADRALCECFGDPGFRRLQGTGKAFEHTLYTGTSALWGIADQRGWTAVRDSRGMRFDAAVPSGGRWTTEVFVPYNDYYSDVTWSYSEARGGYLHSITGEPHVDALTGEQIAASNVVVVYVNHVETLIIEDELGAHSIEIQLWGSGNATVYRDGQAWDVSWRRPSRPDPITLVGRNGHTFPLKPGNTWYDLVPLGMKVTAR